MYARRNARAYYAHANKDRTTHRHGATAAKQHINGAGSINTAMKETETHMPRNTLIMRVKVHR